MQSRTPIAGMSNSDVTKAIVEMQHEETSPYNSEQRQTLDTDFSLDASMLDDKYNPNGDGEHPLFTRSDWRSQVEAQITIIGYWDWVEYRIELYHAGN